MFVGNHERQLDPKGRLALPAPYRSYLGTRCYLAYGSDKCIHVVPADTFEEVAREMLEQVKRGEVSRAEMRATAASATELTVDAQGRINLDERAREYAGLTLGSRVVVAGAFDRVEIWEPSRYQTINTAGNAEIAGVEA